MEDDSNKGLFQNKKNLIAFSLILLTVIYYIYKQISKSPSTTTNHGIVNSEDFKDYLDKEKKRSSKGKKSVTINLDKNYFLNIELLFNILRNLFALKYEIHLIIKIDDKDCPDKYINLMSPLITENIIKKHVSSYCNNIYKRILFCSLNEGVIAIVRSINPSIFIDYLEDTIVGVARFVNTIWILNKTTISFPSNFKIQAKLYYINSLEKLQQMTINDKVNNLKEY